MDKAVMVIERQGSLLRVSRAGGSGFGFCDRSESVKRGFVSDFSMDSKRRLGRLLSTISPHQNIAFLTLTYPKEFPSATVAKQHLRAFMKRLKRLNQKVVMIWKLEFQERGAPHFHVILLNFDFTPHHYMLAMWQEVTKLDVKHLHIESVKGEPHRAYAYMAKYASKGQGSFTYAAYLAANPKERLGRVWGMWGKEHIRFASYEAVMLVWDLEHMQALYSRLIERLDEHIGLDREYAPEFSATFFAGRINDAQLFDIMHATTNEIAAGVHPDDLTCDVFGIDAGGFSMALNRLALIDVVPEAVIPF